MACSGDFAGRVALVTGGTRGIGAAIARALAGADARVYVVFRSNAAAAAELSAELGDRLSTAGQSVRSRAIETTPLGRAGTPEEVADAGAYLASQRAAYVTGAVLQVNGGLYM